jgi:hypothetical protein
LILNSNTGVRYDQRAMGNRLSTAKNYNARS